MHNHPSVAELVQAVKLFVDETAAPNLTGHAAFHARVASNVLATILRDLDARPVAEDEERSRLQSLLRSTETNLDSLNKDLCKRIQSGNMDARTQGLLEHLKATTIAQVEVDQPRYSGLATAKD
jgi:hypothetical protein